MAKDNQMRMKAPKGTQSAFIEGHEYEVPKDGIIRVAVAAHVETLHRHGFTDFEATATHEDVDAMKKAELVEFLEEHGEDTEDMDKAALKARAHELVDEKAKKD